MYWKIYNNVYLGAQDAMVACFPRVKDEMRVVYDPERKAEVELPLTYTRAELDYVL